ncbi:hypothetical protein LTR86_011303 [Recurvomyces mirabilis]|nr:hypothetical protein LTR86_011303 [Recurvomyces mirabilis]
MAFAPTGDYDVAAATSNGYQQNFSSVASRSLNVAEGDGQRAHSLVRSTPQKPRDLISIPQGQSFEFSGIEGLKVVASNFGMAAAGSYEADILTYARDFTPALASSDRWQFQICSPDLQLLVNGSIIVEATGFGRNVESVTAVSCEAAAKAAGT